jgi:hypothetical protein
MGKDSNLHTSYQQSCVLTTRPTFLRRSLNLKSQSLINLRYKSKVYKYLSDRFLHRRPRAGIPNLFLNGDTLDKTSAIPWHPTHSETPTPTFHSIRKENT